MLQYRSSLQTSNAGVTESANGQSTPVGSISLEKSHWQYRNTGVKTWTKVSRFYQDDILPFGLSPEPAETGGISSR